MKWWKNYKYRFTPYVRGDLSRMKNTRYLPAGALGVTNDQMIVELTEVYTDLQRLFAFYTDYSEFKYLNFCHGSSGHLSNFTKRFGFRLAIRFAFFLFLIFKVRRSSTLLKYILIVCYIDKAKSLGQAFFCSREVSSHERGKIITFRFSSLFSEFTQKIKKGQLVALYPGTIYRAWDPQFIQSINNDVFLQCIGN